MRHGLDLGAAEIFLAVFHAQAGDELKLWRQLVFRLANLEERVDGDDSIDPVVLAGEAITRRLRIDDRRGRLNVMRFSTDVAQTPPLVRRGRGGT